MDPAVGVVKSCQVQSTAPTPAPAGTAALTWAAPTGTVTVTGYRVYYGVASRSYSQALGSGAYVKTPSATVSGLLSGRTYYFAVTAVNAAGVESAYSNEASKLIP
jgi:fibronectin type 3 domain-containing protein